ncbi:MAG: phosphate ABC transporter substrate-binding protein [Erysipelotrichia bacterium]|nr:phosphate ABC transporter substrate-binding protein [Erysipelotrichia bacterium]
MKKLFGLLLCCGLLLTGCGSSNEGNESVELSAGGSTSIQPLMEVLAEAFNEEGLGTITVQGGGSGVGIEGASEGTFDIGMASRALKEDEAEALDATEICLDGIVIVVNKNNEVRDITLEDAKKIFTGEITNWKELGGNDSEIAVVSREEGSGTRDGFESVVGFESEELIANASIQNATGAVVSTISGNENAIGYISLGSLTSEVKALSVNGVEASEETISDQTYTLQRPFVLAVKKDSDVAKPLYDFIFSDAGKKIIEDHGYIAVDAK